MKQTVISKELEIVVLPTSSHRRVTETSKTPREDMVDSSKRERESHARRIALGTGIRMVLFVSHQCCQRWTTIAAIPGNKPMKTGNVEVMMVVISIARFCGLNKARLANKKFESRAPR
eukprot:scaffold6436_cov158-Amphora_coffeaeformis.AAC.3